MGREADTVQGTVEGVEGVGGPTGTGLRQGGITLLKSGRGNFLHQDGGK